MPLDRIIVRGAREHNLKNITVEIPRDRFVVLTGISGSGKSSLAFDTIYAEGQRKYVESLSAYARQFLGLMEKPDVDYIEGLSPAVSIDQKGAPRNPRSTVGTVTEIYDYLRLLYARVGQPHCPQCGKPIARQSREQIVDRVLSLPGDSRIQVLGPIVRGRKGEYRQLFEDLRRQGFVRVRVDGSVYDLSEEITLDKNKKHNIEVVVDRLVVRPDVKTRLADSVETALMLGLGIVYVHVLGDGDGPGGRSPASQNVGEAGATRPAPSAKPDDVLVFSQQFACPDHGTVLPEIEPRIFSFNSPYGACPTCSGLGFRQEIDPTLVLDRDLSLMDGAVVPWADTTSEYYYELLQSLAAHYKIDMKTPARRLPKGFIQILMHGSQDNVRVRYHNKWGALRVYETQFEGVINQLERRYKETDSEYIREEIERFMTTLPCPECRGSRLRPESLSVRLGGLNIAELTALPIRQAQEFFARLGVTEREQLIAHQVLKEIRSRLGFMVNVGLDYLTLDRTANTLSGGEAQRIRLATQIGSGLMGVLYVLDEPSVGLHQRDNHRLIRTLLELRDLGNTILVVEHDEETIRSADWVIDIGPGAGAAGGHVVVSGSPDEVARHPESVTGLYLSGRRAIPIPARRRPRGRDALVIRGAREHNLKAIDVRFPLGLFICVTGVSGSGKSTLVDDILYRAAVHALHGTRLRAGAHDRIDGLDRVDKVINIDQSPIGRTPRSNPATYTKTFDLVRDLFTQTPDARMRGYKPGRFSFNVRGGRCEACEGDGIVRIEMHFLPDVYVPCEVCKGKRYNRETLEVMYRGQSIADVLDMTVDDALAFFENVPRIRRKMQTLHDVGLGYVKLGQPATTLSGGEAQRVKLAAELSRRDTGHTLYMLDEPTVGLHFADVERLLQVLHRLVDGGNTVVVIEHNLDVIKTADWIVDLGPEGGELGGTIVAEGTPEEVATTSPSYTSQFLRRVLQDRRVAVAGAPAAAAARTNGRAGNGRRGGRAGGRAGTGALALSRAPLRGRITPDMRIDEFRMERWQSTYETEVGCNLSESGVLPVSAAELVDDASWLTDVLAREPLGYGDTRGSAELRARIAARYDDADPENVLVTTGTAEANFLVTWWLVEPRDRIVLMLPNYMQIDGLARGFGAHVAEWWLRDDAGWRPDLDVLTARAGDETRAIIVCNPNNPTGAVLTTAEMDSIVAAASRSGAWIVADEVYRGAELHGPRTPSFWGRYERVLATGGLSKAFGLPGLRIGWIVGPRDAAQALWARHDYTTIGPASISDRLARAALSPPGEERLARRTRLILQSNLEILKTWLAEQEGHLSLTPPAAGAIAMVKYAARIPSLRLADRLRAEQDVLVVPGEHFGLEGYLRIGYGGQADLLVEGLRRIAALLSTL